MAGEQLKRLAFAAVAIPIVLGIVWYGGLPLVALLSVTGVLAIRELFTFAELAGIRPMRLSGSITAALLPLLVYGNIAYLPEIGDHVVMLFAAWLLFALTMLLLRRGPDEKPLATIAVTFFAILYTVVLPCYLLAIRHLGFARESWAGTWLVLMPLAITWIGDTAAMFGGKALKGPKLAPRVSPGKTRSGSLCGLLATVAAAFAFEAVALRPFDITLSPVQLVIFGVVVSIAGQVGDLVESLFKREVGVKDSSALIPGHGGVLDRLDSLYFAIPAAAVLYRFFGII
jgi:phosphatidate cytidylyltransferase